ncbi:MAG TPA: hypothetical protein PLH57_07090, partial [Oligoflexia bacterium]|nr:hypothetical protein [Oligoflexia bacterium]
VATFCFVIAVQAFASEELRTKSLSCRLWTNSAEFDDTDIPDFAVPLVDVSNETPGRARLQVNSIDKKKMMDIELIFHTHTDSKLIGKVKSTDQTLGEDGRKIELRTVIRTASVHVEPGPKPGEPSFKIDVKGHSKSDDNQCFPKLKFVCLASEEKVENPTPTPTATPTATPTPSASPEVITPAFRS